MKNTVTYNLIVNELRDFFRAKGYLEVPVQSRLSILAACEDPETISTFEFAGETWPLPQTGQMWLEYELLKNPDFPGVYCISTSYRNEKDPIPGRHDLIFPMFEFEGRGDIKDLSSTIYGLLSHLKIAEKKEVKTYNYSRLCKYYDTDILKAEHETLLCQEYGDVIGIQFFPEKSHPFWNMKHDFLNKDKRYNKIDIIIDGIETIGSAERETDVELMDKRFHEISNGEYAQLLFDKFTKKRVLKELYDYLALTMTPRYGAGIGLTRLAKCVERRRND